MDAVERRKRRNKRLLIVSLCVFIPLLWILAGYVFLFHINRFCVDIAMQGDPEITLEYGEPYTEPGVDAVLSGSILLRDGKEIPVSVTGQVDPEKLGTYTVVYRAERGRWHDEARRTIHVVDTTPPQILLNSRPGAYVIPGLGYAEEGFAAGDNHDGNLTDRVIRTETKDRVHYYVEDSSGNSAEITREIVYYDPIPPRLTLEGEESITLEYGGKYKEPGFSATDNCDGDLTEKVAVSGKVNTKRAGTYTVTYTVEDSYGNTASCERTVKVKAKPQPKPQSPSQSGSGGATNQPATVTPSGKVIYLTFDDGPGKYTRKLLDVLKKYNVKATFFVVNTKYTSLLDDIVDEGHAIGIHSTTHDYDEIYASEDAYFEDLYKMQGIIEKKTGVTTTLVRFPGGSSNTVSKFNPGIMTRLTEALTENGFQYYDWNVNSGDAGGTKKTSKVVENVISGCEKRKVSIVLQHDIKSYSVDAVEEIIIWGLENGYRFLPLEPSSPKAHHSVRN